MILPALPLSLGRYHGLFNEYRHFIDGYDEYFDKEGQMQQSLEKAITLLDQIPLEKVIEYHHLAQRSLRAGGVTFNVYSDNQGTEKIFPFDIFPRIISKEKWLKIQKGLQQRVMALNCFLNDIYHEQKILKDRFLPEELILSADGYHSKLRNLKPFGGTYIHIAGVDLLSVAGEYIVLEDNLRTPSGVSYVLENRHVMKTLFPQILEQLKIHPVEDYPLQLRQTLLKLAAPLSAEPRLVLLTPGPYNSAYFEHTFLARRMGCPLVQNSDLQVVEDKVYLKSLHGLQRVHVIYRRIDDNYLDPEVFNNESLLGVRGIVRAYASGQVILANALGNSIADDKAIYPYVPTIIRYYLNEEPILNQVSTYSCYDEKERSYVLDNISKLVIKVVNGSGGYGMVIGPQASHSQLENIRQCILKNPRAYIAQPLQEFSHCPTFNVDGITPRRVDFRPFVIMGTKLWVLPGGLTRVALQEGSYVVNSSQGGGAKDTWVLT